MRHFMFVAAAALALMVGCKSRNTATSGPRGPQGPHYDTQRYRIPGDVNELNSFILRDDNGKCLYVVLKYGFFNDLIEWAGSEGNPGGVSIDGKSVAVATDGGVYVVDPGLKLHRAPMTGEELRSQLSPTSSIYFESQQWRDDLLPLLQKHAWQRPNDEKP